MPARSNALHNFCIVKSPVSDSTLFAYASTHTPAVHMASGEVYLAVLVGRVLVIGRLGERRHRLGVIPRHPLTVAIKDAEKVLGVAIPVFRQMAKHPHGVLVVLFATLAFVAHQP
jgi:hypothetical protein